jgi:hypothetical protein
LEKYGKLFSNSLRFHALVNSDIKIFGFGSEKWISLVGKKLPYFSNSYMDENSYFVIVFAGPNLPKITDEAAMVPTPDGTGVVLIGGSATRKDLYELKCSSSSCNWSLMEQQLSVHRSLHVVMYVPDSFVNCEH